MKTIVYTNIPRDVFEPAAKELLWFADRHEGLSIRVESHPDLGVGEVRIQWALGLAIVEPNLDKLKALLATSFTRRGWRLVSGSEMAARMARIKKKEKQAKFRAALANVVSEHLDGTLEMIEAWSDLPLYIEGAVPSMAEYCESPDELFGWAVSQSGIPWLEIP